MVRVANVKMPRLLAFARHVETAIIKIQKPRSATVMGSRTLLFSGVFGGGTRLAMPKTTLCAGLIVIEAWFRGY